MNNKKLMFGIILIAIVLIGGLFAYQRYTLRAPTTSVVPTEVVDSFNKGDLNKAIEVSTNTLRSDPNNIATLIALSLSWAQKGSTEFKEKEYGQKALDYAKEALKLDPTSVKAYIALGYATEIMSNFPGAIDAYSSAISLDSNSSSAYVHRGHAYDLSGDLKSAEIDYLRADSLDTTNLDVKMNLGRLYSRQSKVEEAKKQFLLVTSFADNTRIRSEAYYDLSFLALSSTSTKAIDNAFAYASSSISTDPTYPQAYVAMGNAYMLKGDYVKALEMLNKSLSMYPNLSYAMGLIANIYGKQGDVDLAIKNYEAQKAAALVDIGLMNNDRPIVISRADMNEAYTYAENNKKEEAASKLKEIIANSKDPGSDIGIFIVLSDTGPYGRLKNLSNYKPFTDLVSQFKNKIKSGFKVSNTQIKPVSLLEKIIGYFNFKKVNASANVAGLCKTGVVNNGGFIYYTNPGGYDGSPLAVATCELMRNYVNGNVDYDYATAFANLNALVLSYHASIGASYSLSEDGSYVGCANGVGAAFQAAPPSPSGAGVSCSTDGRAANLAWVNPSGYDTVYIRIVDKTIHPTVTMGADFSASNHNWIDSYTGSSYSSAVVPDHTYMWWIHTRDTKTGFWSALVGGEFNCTPAPVVTTGGSLALSCKADAVAVSTDVTYEATPYNASSTVSYKWYKDGTLLSGNNSPLLTTYGYDTSGIHTSVSVSAVDSAYPEVIAQASCSVKVGCTDSRPKDTCTEGTQTNYSCVGNSWIPTKTIVGTCSSEFTNLGSDLKVIPAISIVTFKFRSNIVPVGGKCPLYLDAQNVKSCSLINKSGQVSVPVTSLPVVDNNIKLDGQVSISVGTHTLKCVGLGDKAIEIPVGVKTCYSSPNYGEN
ncbi:MAG: tetratricopeptide repeat protein [bacterium]